MKYSLTVLGLLWVVFGVSHSILADLRVKNVLYRTFKISPKTYRVFYNLFAGFFLTALAYLQVVWHSTLLFQPTTTTKLLSLVVGTAGVAIMVVCVVKYFRQLSGMFTESLIPKLETGGLHQFVRHPLYLGTIIFILGLLLYFPYVKNAIAAVIICTYTVIGALLEERKLVHTFGEAYRKYQEEVPMILPWTFSRKKKRTSAGNGGRFKCMLF